MLAVLVSGLSVSPFTNQAVEPSKLQVHHPAGKAAGKASALDNNKTAVGEALDNNKTAVGETGADRMAARKAEHEKMKAQREAENAERSAGKERLKAVGKIDPQHFLDVCEKIVQGSRTHDYDTFEYNGPVSDREVVFNLGAYKTGSTSFDAAAAQLGLRSCKTGWGDLGPGGDISFQIDGLKWFNDCPVRNGSSGHRNECMPNAQVEIFQRAIANCAVVGDAPWPYLYPTLMRAFPKAKFVYTRQKTCSDWIYHVTGLYEAGLSGGPLLPCWYGRDLSSKPHDASWLDRCVETERTIVLTAQKFNLPLLVLHAGGQHANLEMELVSKFLGKEMGPSVRKNYPHVPTPAAHNVHDQLPAADVFDPNFDLWHGWNGGVPVGDFSRKPHSSKGGESFKAEEEEALKATDKLSARP